MRNARQILQLSLSDIEKGKWIQSELGSCTRDGNNCERIGCALGLVAIHGEDYSDEYTSKGGMTTYTLKYATDNSPNAVRKAVAALAATIPAKTRKEIVMSYEPVGDNGDHIDFLNNLVWSYNDRGTTTAKIAAQWFKRALKVVSKTAVPGNTADNEQLQLAGV
jgi:hypothetical protein